MRLTRHSWSLRESEGFAKGSFHEVLHLVLRGTNKRAEVPKEEVPECNLSAGDCTRMNREELRNVLEEGKEPDHGVEEVLPVLHRSNRRNATEEEEGETKKVFRRIQEEEGRVLHDTKGPGVLHRATRNVAAHTETESDQRRKEVRRKDEAVSHSPQDLLLTIHCVVPWFLEYAWMRLMRVVWRS